MAKADVIPGSINETEDMKSNAEGLYRIYLPLVRSVVRRILPQLEDAEECINDVMLELLMHPEKYDAARGSYSTTVQRLTAETFDHPVRRFTRLPLTIAAGIMLVAGLTGGMLALYRHVRHPVVLHPHSPVESATHSPLLAPYLTASSSASSFGGAWAFSADQLLPSGSVILPEAGAALPVYQAIRTDSDDMRRSIQHIADLLGTDITRWEETSNEANAGYLLLSAYTEDNEAGCRTICSDSLGMTGILFKKAGDTHSYAVAPPDSIRLSTITDREERIRAYGELASYYYQQYAFLCDVEISDPVVRVQTLYYDTLGEKETINDVKTCIVFDRSRSGPDCPIVSMELGIHPLTGELESLRLPCRPVRIGDYPVITSDQAVQLWLEGRSVTLDTDATYPLESNRVETVELTYLPYHSAGAIIPYYVLYVRADHPQTTGAYDELNWYVRCYVPAVSPEKIDWTIFSLRPLE